MDMANEIKKQVYELLMKYYNSYKNNSSISLKNKYNSILHIYKIINDKDFEFIEKYFKENNIPNEVMNIFNKVTNKNTNNKSDNDRLFVSMIKKQMYNALLEQYNKAKNDKQEINKYNYMKSIYEEVNLKNKAIEIISLFKELKRELNTKNDSERKAILDSLNIFINVSNTLNLTSNKEVKKEHKFYEYKYKTDDREINNLINLSNKILKLQDKLNSIDNTSNEAINIRKEINDLSDQRESILDKYMDMYGIMLSKELESLEISYVKEKKVNKEKNYTLKSSEYEKELRNTIYKLNDLKFHNKNDEELQITINKYNSLISSLYKDDNPIIYSEENSGLTIRNENLLSYLELYNLKGGYNEFKRVRDSLKIGNQIVTLSVYEKKIKELENMINVFVSNSSKMINNDIVIVDNNKNKDSIKEEIETKITEIISEIEKVKSKNKGLSKESPSLDIGYGIR